MGNGIFKFGAISWKTTRSRLERWMDLWKKRIGLGRLGFVVWIGCAALCVCVCECNASYFDCSMQCSLVERLHSEPGDSSPSRLWALWLPGWFGCVFWLSMGSPFKCFGYDVLCKCQALALVLLTMMSGAQWCDVSRLLLWARMRALALVILCWIYIKLVGVAWML